MGMKQIPGYHVEFPVNNPMICNPVFWTVHVPLRQLQLTVNMPWINKRC